MYEGVSSETQRNESLPSGFVCPADRVPAWNSWCSHFWSNDPKDENWAKTGLPSKTGSKVSFERACRSAMWPFGGPPEHRRTIDRYLRFCPTFRLLDRSTHCPYQGVILSCLELIKSRLKRCKHKCQDCRVVMICSSRRDEWFLSGSCSMKAHTARIVKSWDYDTLLLKFSERSWKTFRWSIKPCKELCKAPPWCLPGVDPMRWTLAEEKSKHLHLSTAEEGPLPLIRKALKYAISSISNLDVAGLLASCKSRC